MRWFLVEPVCVMEQSCATTGSLLFSTHGYTSHATDMPAYARLYHAGRLGQTVAWARLRKIHNAADRTLAPSSATASELHAHGVKRVWLWARGVDSARFDPATRWRPEAATRLVGPLDDQQAALFATNSGKRLLNAGADANGRG